jgi:hypothetical protein
MGCTAIIISTSALGFTIFSFWWMNWRKGKIRLGSNLRSYAARASQNKLLIELPLIFFNTGAVPLVVENLRLYFPKITEENKYLFFNATVVNLGTDEDRGFAKPFSIHGGDVMEMICEFQNTSTSFRFEEAEYEFKIQALLGHKEQWITLKKYIINARGNELKTLNERLITHDNQKMQSYTALQLKSVLSCLLG